MNKQNNDCKEWSTTNLGSIVKFVSGGTPKKDEEKYWNGEIPWVSSGEMSESRIYKTQLNVTEDGAINGTRLAPKNTVFVVVRGMSLAKEFRVSLAMKEMTFNQDVKAIFPSKTIDPIFLFYYLKFQSNPIRDSASEAAHGTKKLDMPVLEQWPISLPRIPTQKKIAAILSAYDDLIENNKRRIALLEKMAEEIYKEWFVRFHFPGYQTAEFEKGIPKGWKETKLKNIVDLKSGFAFKSEKYEMGSRYGIVTIKNVHDGKFIKECSDHVAEPPERLPRHCFIKSGDILMSLTGNVGRVCIAYGQDLLLNQRVVLLKPKIKSHSHYIYWLFRQKTMLTFCELISTGVAQQNLSPIKLNEQKIIYPIDDLIEEYQVQVNPLMNNIATLLQKNDLLEKTKCALLPRLISGKLSVQDLDIQFPPSMQENSAA